MEEASIKLKVVIQTGFAFELIQLVVKFQQQKNVLRIP